MLMSLFKALCCLMLLKFSQSDTTWVYSPVACCGNGWISYEGNCYLFASQGVHFIEAEHYCQQHGGHMVEVFSSKENAFIKDQLKRLKPGCGWMGLTDEHTEGSWRWLNDPNPVNFTDWVPGQTVHDSEDCGGYYSVHGYKWEDGHCSDICLPICKQRGGVEIPDIVG